METAEPAAASAESSAPDSTPQSAPTATPPSAPTQSQPSIESEQPPAEQPLRPPTTGYGYPPPQQPSTAPGQHPVGQPPYPYQYQQYQQYPGPAPAPAPAIRRPPLFTSFDVISALRDGLIPLATVLVGTFAAVVALAYLISSQNHGGFPDWFTSSVILVAGAFGAPASLSFGSSDTANDGSGFSLPLGVHLSISITVWTITLTLLWLLARRARRNETLAPSGSPVQAVVRSVLPAVAVSLVLLILALVSSASDLFKLGDSLFGSGANSPSGSGVDPFGGGGGSSGDGSGSGSGAGSDLGGFGGLGSSTSGGSGVHESVGVVPGWVLLGPLLLTAAACLLGRLLAISRRPAGDPGGEWIRKLIMPWRAAAATVWTQLRAIAALAALALTIYLAVQIATGSAPGRQKGAAVLALVLLIPNLALGGALTGFCVTLFAGAELGGGLLGVRAQQVGLFGDSRPWLIYILILTALLGTALPWLLVRLGRRRVVVESFGPGQVWRAALLGAAAAFFVALLGQASISGGLGLGALGGSGATFGLIYSLIGAVVAGAFWCAAGYLAVAYQIRPRTPATSIAGPSPGHPYGSWPTTTPAPAPHQTQQPAQHPTPAPTPAPDGAPTPVTQPGPGNVPTPEGS